jgi:hypothetical protein
MIKLVDVYSQSRVTNEKTILKMKVGIMMGLEARIVMVQFIQHSLVLLLLLTSTLSNDLEPFIVMIHRAASW